MKITRSKLQQIIKEEMAAAIKEMEADSAVEEAGWGTRRQYDTGWADDPVRSRSRKKDEKITMAIGGDALAVKDAFNQARAAKDDTAAAAEAKKNFDNLAINLKKKIRAILSKDPGGKSAVENVLQDYFKDVPNVRDWFLATPKAPTSAN